MPMMKTGLGLLSMLGMAITDRVAGLPDGDPQRHELDE
jgi:hypothetical protein